MFIKPIKDLKKLLKKREEISFAMIEAKEQQLQELEEELEEVENMIFDTEQEFEDMKELRKNYEDYR